MTQESNHSRFALEGSGVTLAIEKLDSMTSSNVIATRYAIDSGVSRLTVRAFATGFLSALGHNPVISVRGLTGAADLVEGTLEQATLHARVKTDSLSVENDISDKDRREMQRAMNQDVLEAGKFPEITYECSRISGNIAGEGQFVFTLEGELTLHGVTRAEPISGRAFMTGDLLRASGEFAVRLSDYQITPVSAVGGGLKLKDELKVTFDVVARKQG
jgi:polyisoprenoid-binding protein YceI